MAENRFRNAVSIGAKGLPWPTLLRHEKMEDGKAVRVEELGVIDGGRTLTLHSERDPEEVLARLYRGMVVPSQLRAFEKIVRLTNPAQNNRIAYLFSNPGLGKSVGAVNLCKARDSRGPIITDAGGKNLEYLLHETVFDAEESRPLTKAIDDALAAGTLDSVSVQAMRKAFRTHFHDDGKMQLVDWEGLTTDEQIDHQKIQEALKLVQVNERWDQAKLGIGFKECKGPLVLAQEQERDLIIDELGKCKRGSEGPLQQVWQVLNGEIAEHTVSLGSLGNFTFHRGGPGIVIASSNYPSDGQATHLISDSFDSRVPRIDLPDFTVEDWQHRFCQHLTDLPISTLAHLVPRHKVGVGEKEHLVIDDPKEFGEMLMFLHDWKRTEAEIDSPASQREKSQLANWQNVLEFSQKFGAYFHRRAEMADPHSRMYADGKGNLNALLTDIENPDIPTPKVTPRAMLKLMDDALQLEPSRKPAGESGGFQLKERDWSKLIEPAQEEAVENNYGSRLIRLLEDDADVASAHGRKAVYQKQLRATAEENDLHDSNSATAQLLNCAPYQSISPAAQSRAAQSMLAAHLRGRLPHLGLSDDDEEVVPLGQIGPALEGIEKTDSHMTPYMQRLHVPSVDIEGLTCL